MRVSISQVKDFLTCPTIAHNRHVLRKGLDKRSEALDFGTLWHREMAIALDPTWDPPEIEIPKETLEDYFLWRQEAPWQRPEGWEVKGVEVKMSMPLGPHEIVGTLDAVVVWNGKYWHVQHKSLAESVPVSVFCEQQRLDFHEVCYQRMMEQSMTPVGGTILNVLRKLSRKRLRAGENPYVIETMTRERELVEETLRDLEQVVGEMERQGGQPVKNRSACSGIYRNSLCQYHPVCGREITLEDERYVDLEERYPE